MLLGSTKNQQSLTDTEPLVIQLLIQERYAEVYELLIKQTPMLTSSLYNIALCLFWSENYHEALNHLNSIQIDWRTGNESKLGTDPTYNGIRKKQNQTDDYFHGISEGYAISFPGLFQDAVARLKTDCFLQVGDFAKVISTATPIAHKGYKNINDALQLANAKNVNNKI